MAIQLVLWEIWCILWEVQNLPEKWQILDWSWVTEIERSSSWNHPYKWLRNLGLVLRGARNIERFMIVQVYSSGILSSEQRSKRRSKPNTNKIVHLIINNSQCIWVKNGFHIGIHYLHQAIIIGLHDASWKAKLESNDYPLLQRSKVKLPDICIHTMLRTWLMHIVIYSDH